jgi:hypothetical protein
MADSAEDLQARVGAPLELVAVAVRDLSKPRPGIPTDLLTDDPFSVVKREDVDIVVEVMGGIDPTKELLETALRNGASVITANKALLSEHGATLHEIAYENGVDLFYEAAVAGAIPLLRPLRESLAGDQVQRVLGIVNGTTNYILTKMDEEGADYARRARRGPAPRVRRGRPHRRCRGSRCGRQGSDPGHPGLPLQRHPVRRLLRGHQFGVTLARHRSRHAISGSSSNCWPSPSARRTATAWSPGSTRRWWRARTPSPASATPSTPCSWRRSRPAR